MTRVPLHFLQSPVCSVPMKHLVLSTPASTVGKGEEREVVMRRRSEYTTNVLEACPVPTTFLANLLTFFLKEKNWSFRLHHGCHTQHTPNLKRYKKFCSFIAPLYIPVRGFQRCNREWVWRLCSDARFSNDGECDPVSTPISRKTDKRKA